MRSAPPTTTLYIVMLLAAALLGAVGPTPASSQPSGSYPVCGHIEPGWASALLKNAYTGATQAVLIAGLRSGINQVIPAPPGSLEVLALGGSAERPWSLMLDKRNGSILITVLPPIDNLTSNKPLTLQAVEAYRLSLENGFIEKAYARIHNASAQVYAQAVFTQGNKSFVSLVRVDIGLRPEPHAVATRIPAAGLQLRGQVPCDAVLVNATNESIDIAPLFVPQAQGIRIYHLPAAQGAPIDPVSMVARRKIAGVIAASHGRGLTSSLVIIDIDEHESKASFYTTGPIPGYVIVNPLQIARLNSTAYVINAWAVDSRGEQASLAVVAVLGFEPKALVYRAPRGATLTVSDADRLIVISGNSVQIFPYEKIRSELQLEASIPLNKTVKGFTYEPLRSGQTVNTTIEQVNLTTPLPPANQTTTSNTTTSTPNETTSTQQGQARAPPPAPPSKKAPAQKRLAIAAVAAVVVIAGGAGAYLVRRRSSKEELASPVFRY